MIAFIGLLILVIVSNCYLVLRQKYILEKFTRLIWKFTQNDLNPIRLFRNWGVYMGLNRQTLHICADIREYSRFWSFLLSFQIAFTISILCFWLHFIFTLAESKGVHPGEERASHMLGYYLGVGELDITTFLYLITTECAQVVTNNQRILRQNRQFYLALSRSSQSLAFKARASCLIKVYFSKSTLQML